VTISGFTVSNNGIALDDVTVAVIVGIACDCVTVAADDKGSLRLLILQLLQGSISLLRFAEA